MERPTIVANEDNTEIYLNGNTATPFATLQAGDYIAINGSEYSANNNLYISSSKNVFAYQAIGGSPSQANQDVYFAPPLSCETPKKIDNIPLINQIGSNGDFTGSVAVVTETGSTLSFIIDGTPYTLANLPSGVTATAARPAYWETRLLKPILLKDYRVIFRCILQARYMFRILDQAAQRLTADFIRVLRSSLKSLSAKLTPRSIRIVFPM
ncbi:hypothetical protein [Flavobacterium sp. 3HN19-14]|uniref:hypothetical protein n=1 Tax=Flavobacterium sp. 3HN19-14 TaxID=3448133 RepID=UPI003EE0F8FC